MNEPPGWNARRLVVAVAAGLFGLALLLACLYGLIVAFFVFVMPDLRFTG